MPRPAASEALRSSFSAADDNDAAPPASLRRSDTFPAQPRRAINNPEPDDNDADIPLAPLQVLRMSSGYNKNKERVIITEHVDSDEEMPLAPLHGLRMFSGKGLNEEQGAGNVCVHVDSDEDIPLAPLHGLRTLSGKGPDEERGACDVRVDSDEDIPLAPLHGLRMLTKKGPDERWDADTEQVDNDEDIPLAPLHGFRTLQDVDSRTAIDVDSEEPDLQSHHQDTAVARQIISHSPAEGSDIDALESDGDVPASIHEGRQTFVVDPRDMQDFGIGLREDIPAVPMSDGQILSFSEWSSRQMEGHSTGAEMDSPLRRRVRHEAQAVYQLGNVYRQLVRAQSILVGLRDTATGLILSPYVGAASSLQGFDIGIVETGAEEDRV